VKLLDKINAYLKDYLVLANLSKSYAPLLRELIGNKNQDGHIFINSALKRVLSEKLDMAVGSIDNAITKLVEGGILIRIDRGMYIVNRDIVDFCSLKEGENLMISINYSDNGREIQSIKQ
jgi:hypothetical protein